MTPAIAKVLTRMLKIRKRDLTAELKESKRLLALYQKRNRERGEYNRDGHLWDNYVEEHTEGVKAESAELAEVNAALKDLEKV